MSSRPTSRLQAVRDERDMSRREVAEQLEISEQQLYRYEVGITPITRRTLVALAVIYGVTVEDLTGEVAA